MKSKEVFEMKRGRWDSESEDEHEHEKKKKLEKKKEKVREKDKKSIKNKLKEDQTSTSDVQPTAVQVRAATRNYQPPFGRCRCIDDVYEKQNFIGQGTYGAVFKAKSKEDNEIYALKQVKLEGSVSSTGFPVAGLREINVLLSLQHPNIIKVKEMVIGNTTDQIFMVMEYCENDLKTCMQQNKQSFSSAEVRSIF